MPKLDRTGPEGKGSGTGRKLGKCNKASTEEKAERLGKGMGSRRNADEGIGKGKRFRSGNHLQS